MPDVMEVIEQPVIERTVVEKPKVAKIIRSKHEKLGQKNRMDQTYTDVNDIFYSSEMTPSFIYWGRSSRYYLSRWPRK